MKTKKKFELEQAKKSMDFQGLLPLLQNLLPLQYQIIKRIKNKTKLGQ